MRKKLWAILVLIILMASTLVGCGSSPSRFTMASTTGVDISVMKEGAASWVDAQVGMSLAPGDIVKSGDNSSAEITFVDGSTIELDAGTEIEIVSLDISTDTDSTTIRVKQTIGSIIFRVTKIVDPASHYEVETPTGVVAIRGSAMQVYVIEDGTTWATNLEGDIWAAAQGVELEIPEGRQCVIVPDEPPELICDLTISSTTGGSVTVPGEGTFSYSEGTVVDLWSEAEGCHVFVGWSGDVTTLTNVNAAIATITMNDSYSITANFELGGLLYAANAELHAVQAALIGAMQDAGAAELTTWGDWYGEPGLITVVVGNVTYDARDYIYGQFRATYTIQQDASIINGYCNYPGGWGDSITWDPVKGSWVCTS